MSEVNQGLLSKMLAAGFKLPKPEDRIVSMTEVRDQVVIVTEEAIYKAKPDYQVEFVVEQIWRFY